TGVSRRRDLRRVPPAWEHLPTARRAAASSILNGLLSTTSSRWNQTFPGFLTKKRFARAPNTQPTQAEGPSRNRDGCHPCPGKSLTSKSPSISFCVDSTSIRRAGGACSICFAHGIRACVEARKPKGANWARGDGQRVGHR